MKKLKILLMTPWMEYFLGAETHIYSIAKELLRMGHEVDMYTYLKGAIWKIIENSGINLLEDDPKDKYDIVIANGNPCVAKMPKSAYKIMICNGIIPPQEYPIHGIDRYIAVSEEVSKELETKGYKNIIIRNGIDCDRYLSVNPPNKKLKNVLIISNKQNPQSAIFQIIAEVCRDMGIKLSALGLKIGTSQWEVVDFINQNDLVISLGRGILEGMACERNVIVCDYQGIDGFIDNKSYLEIRKNNFSGRRYKRLISKNVVMNEFKKYDTNQGIKNRNIILQHHNIQKTVQNILQLYENRGLNM